MLRKFRPAVLTTHTEFRTGAESVKIRRKSLVYIGLILQTARVECMLKRAASNAAKHALRAFRLLRKLGNHFMISVKIRRKSLVYMGLILQIRNPDSVHSASDFLRPDEVEAKVWR